MPSLTHPQIADLHAEPQAEAASRCRARHFFALTDSSSATNSLEVLAFARGFQIVVPPIGRESGPGLDEDFHNGTNRVIGKQIVISAEVTKSGSFLTWPGRLTSVTDGELMIEVKEGEVVLKMRYTRLK